MYQEMFLKETTMGSLNPISKLLYMLKPNKKQIHINEETPQQIIQHYLP